jgi:hypothetical protein
LWIYLNRFVVDRSSQQLVRLGELASVAQLFLRQSSSARSSAERIVPVRKPCQSG